MRFVPSSRTNILHYISENENKREAFLQKLQHYHQNVYQQLIGRSPQLHKPQIVFDECSILYGTNGKEVQQYFMNIPENVSEQELQLEGTILDLLHRNHPLFQAFKNVKPKDYFLQEGIPLEYEHKGKKEQAILLELF